jgi:hypothetical protein
LEMLPNWDKMRTAEGACRLAGACPLQASSAAAPIRSRPM